MLRRSSTLLEPLGSRGTVSSDPDFRETLRSAQVRRISWVRRVGRFQTGLSGLLVQTRSGPATNFSASSLAAETKRAPLAVLFLRCRPRRPGKALGAAI